MMDAVAALRTDLAQVEAQLDALNQQRHELRDKLAHAQARFKVGDRVTYDGTDCVWQVTAICPAFTDDEPHYQGSKIKKDGTPSAKCSTIYVPWKKTLVLAGAQ